MTHAMDRKPWLAHGQNNNKTDAPTDRAYWD